METVEQAIANARTESGKTLAQMSQQSPVLVVFLRHSGCPYCRQTLSKLASLKSQLQSSKIQLVIVHQDQPSQGAAWIARYGLTEADQISDPSLKLYEQFSLGKTSYWNLVGPHTWWAGFKASILQMHGVSKIVGDIKQLTGAFLIKDGKLVKSFRQSLSHQQPDFNSMVCDLP